MVRQVLSQLLRSGHPLECPVFAADCAARLLGSRARTGAAGTAGQRRIRHAPTVEILLAAYNGERFLREPAGFAAGTDHGSNGI